MNCLATLLSAVADGPNLAKKIKQLRKVKGVTQEQARTDTGIHIARIEQGKRDISYTTLVKLSVPITIGIGVDLNAFV